MIRGRRVVTPDGTREACIHIANGSDRARGGVRRRAVGVPLVDVGDGVILPGLVDTHVHVNEPGRTEWEGFDTATRAAAAGGVTTILDMPLNSIPATTTPEARVRGGRGKVHVDVGFWGGAVPGNLGDLGDLHRAGVFGFKAFMCPSGVTEFPPLDLDQLREAMTEIAAFDGLLIVHAELPNRSKRRRNAWPGRTRSRTDVPGIPTARVRGAGGRWRIAASLATGCRTHVLHLSASSCLDSSMVRRGGSRPRPVLTTSRSKPRRSDGTTEFKCAPPDPGRREPGTSVGGSSSRGALERRVRPFTVHTGAEGRFVLRGVGRHRLGGARPPGGLDRGPCPRVRARGRLPLDERRSGPDRRART